MTLVSILYVSTSTMVGDAAAEIERILAVARARNQQLGITGAILFTGSHFAQCIEGPTAVVDDLMEHIGRDPRHADVTVIQRAVRDTRLFDGWSMAYAGPSLFVKRTLNLSLAERGRRVAADKLLRLLREFST